MLGLGGEGCTITKHTIHKTVGGVTMYPLSMPLKYLSLQNDYVPNVQKVTKNRRGTLQNHMQIMATTPAQP